MKPVSVVMFLAGMSLVAPLLPSQSQDGTAVDPAIRERDQPPRMAIVGASVSAGFVDGPLTGGDPENRTVPLQKILHGWLKDIDGSVRTHADPLFFRDPVGKGKVQIKRALAGEPDVIVGIDFLFWYGYGYPRGAGSEQEQRLRRLDKGLQELERCKCTASLSA